MLKDEFKSKFIQSFQDSLNKTLMNNIISPSLPDSIRIIEKDSTKIPNFINDREPKNIPNNYLSLLNIREVEKQSTPIYPTIFDFFSNPIEEYASAHSSISQQHGSFPTESLKHSNKRKTMNLDISSRKFTKSQSGQSYYKPSHEQKIKIMDSFFTSIPLESNQHRKIYEKLNLIPAYAEGTPPNAPISTPTIAMVGEKGPEQIIPHRKTDIQELSLSNNARSVPSHISSGHSEIMDSESNINSSISDVGPLLPQQPDSFIFYSQGLPKMDGYYN